MNENQDLNSLNNNKDLLGPKSVLNVEAQKELINHTFKESRKNIMKIFLTVFPIMIGFIVLMILTILYFTGTLSQLSN